MSSFNPGGPPPKKETVYGGPDPFAVSSSSNPSAQGAAVGMKKETVYGGGVNADPKLQAAYNSQTLSPAKTSNSVAKQATETKLRRASTWFFITAAILAVEAYFFWGSTFHGASALLGPSSALLAAIYLVLGFSARQLNPTVFLVAVIAYGLQMLLYLFLLFTTDLGMIIFLRPLIVKSYILYKLWGYYHEVRLYHEPV